MHLRGQRLRGRVVVNRGKEEDVASVPHRSFDETTTSRADSQCKVMETRWGPEHFQERQGYLGKIIWGYHIIHLYIHSSLEWTLYLRSPLVLRWGIAAGMLWSDCTLQVSASTCGADELLKSLGNAFRGSTFKVRQFVIWRQNKDLQTRMQMVSKGQGAALKARSL